MKKIFLFILFTIAGCFVVLAQPGTVDTTFGTGGIVTNDLGITSSSIGYDVAIQPDGKIVTVGVGNNAFALTRCDSTGIIDSSFGAGGKVLSSILNSSCSARDVELQSDGKIVVAGDLHAVLGVVRYKSNGSIDSAFGTSGCAYISLGSVVNQKTRGVAIQPDGKIVITGHVTWSSVDSKMAVVRFTANGILDNTFGTAGATTTYASGYCEATGIALQTDGKIVIVGTASNGTDNDIALVRYNTNGSIDSTFGINGIVITSIAPGDDEANAIIIQPDGKILVCGKSGNDFAILRYNTNGSLDNLFGISGIVLTTLAATNNVAYSLKVQNDGKIVVVGRADHDFGIARYNSNGTADTTFGSAGKTITAVVLFDDFATGMAIQANGKIIAVGGASFGGDYEFCMVRYRINGSVYTLPPSPNWAWANGYSGIYNSQGRGICTDNIGNTYVTGMFESATITFGSTVLNNAGGKDVFIVKYDPNGTVLWARRAGGGSDDYGNGLCIDVSGNVFMVGQFAGTTMNIGGVILTGHGGVDLFVAKYDASGNLIWANGAGGSSGDVAVSVSADLFGNAYVTGSFYSSSVMFGSYVLTNSNSSFSDLYLIKYNSSGGVVWAKDAGINYSESANAVQIDGVGNVYMAGIFEGPSITFGSVVLTNTAGFGRNVFIAKYDTAGNVLWAKSAGFGTYYNNASGLAVDTDNNIYMTGAFSGATITFDTIVLTNTQAGSNNIFIVKYDSIGNVIWARAAGGAGDEQSTGISCNMNGNIYITGYFGSAIIYYGGYHLITSGQEDVFISKYDLSGNVVWAKRAGGIYSERSMGVSSDVNDNVFITGYYQSINMYIDSLMLINLHPPSWVAFVSKIDGNTVITDAPVNHAGQILVSVFPNPSQGSFWVKGKNMEEIRIYNLFGELVHFQYNLGQASLVEIDFSGYAKGIYFIEIFCDKNSYCQKILIH